MFFPSSLEFRKLICSEIEWLVQGYLAGILMRTLGFKWETQQKVIETKKWMYWLTLLVSWGMWLVSGMVAFRGLNDLGHFLLLLASFVYRLSCLWQLLVCNLPFYQPQWKELSFFFLFPKYQHKMWTWFSGPFLNQSSFMVARELESYHWLGLGHMPPLKQDWNHS